MTSILFVFVFVFFCCFFEETTYEEALDFLVEKYL